MAKYKKKLDDDIRCPLEYGLTLFGGKWHREICEEQIKRCFIFSKYEKQSVACKKHVPRG